MHDNVSLAVIAYPFAFITYMVKFYLHEHAASMKTLSFGLACASILIPISFLVLLVLGDLFPYAALGYGVIGLGLFATGVYRLLRI